MNTRSDPRPLDALLQFRSEKVHAARGQLAECQARVKRLGAEAQHIATTIEQHESAARVAVQAAGPASGLTVCVRLVDALESALAARGEQLAEARGALEASQERLRESLADLKAVHALQGRRAATDKVRATWRQMRDSDDLAALGHGRRERG